MTGRMRTLIYTSIVFIGFSAYAATPPSGARNNDQAVNVVDVLKYQTPEAMDLAGLTSSTLPEHPWSSSYWPYYSGVLADRYADPDFPDSDDWKTNADYILNHLGSSPVDRLSPAEKYDLLVGDRAFTLTHQMLALGERYYDAAQTVPSWMGICNGWASAAYMTQRPLHWIQALAADGKTWIPFYPADLKALASLLWTNGTISVRGIGGRCYPENPATDENGRPTDPDCLDTNPGTWHLAVVNQIGVSHRSLIMDKIWNAQVWNQPISGYSYSYFNPQTGESVQTAKDATVLLSDYPEDPLRPYRAPNAVAILGVEMWVSYSVETQPTAAMNDDSSDDRDQTTYYRYDLELDSSGTIIGGEWRTQNHPDFLWTPAAGSSAKSKGDLWLDQLGDHESWTGLQPLPERWKAAVSQSSQAGQPLERVVDSLIALSRR